MFWYISLKSEQLIFQAAAESVEAVAFSFLTNEEIHKTSFVKIKNPILLDSVERPVPAGLYDPALGPLDERTLYV